MKDDGFSLADSFDIDNGQLDGIQPHVCFVLGVEWMMVRNDCDSPKAIGRPVHSQNRDRIAAMFDRRGRPFTMTFMQNDSSENWLWLDSPRPHGDRP